ncbi:glycogen synthase [Lacinutrix sp. C3R15]|uniref:glycogen synthase n=1 Tax=Flavobacteriaceae TaxID=49546 RepID=UPI001C095390|nr:MULTISPECIES: glycogen synthase [Flavobacteriaceae]MBU2940315.1 glycogen synthase [Lacinutrix sp. C3R15]MDO6623635.1 glycogen synthase [Oceanihabitans sp. 1_MG-2023]
MNITHISAECYPIAKVGGLADVVGALPKYQNVLGLKSSVIMPFYDNSFTTDNTFVSIFNSQVTLGETTHAFNVLQLNNNTLAFDVFFIDVPDLLYKDYVYSFDDTDRFLAFQIVALNWILTLSVKPDIIHCHDHHTGLIPFMLQESFKYKTLNKIPVIATIHNAQYQGWFSYDKLHFIPEFDMQKVGLLDWNGVINPLAAAIKCAWRVTTVSPSYLEELKQEANGLQDLLKHEYKKCVGILNGIDANVWNPETDTFILENFSIDHIDSGKKQNKNWLCETFNLDKSKPLFAFIGRLVGEKGADLLPEVCDTILQNKESNILLLGSGNTEVEAQLNALKETHKANYNVFIGYDEKLSHIIYAGADFLIMPSRVEPCGLNQMYSLRYGTIPIVRSTGGLKDTVVDIKDKKGFGICHDETNALEIEQAIYRAIILYKNQEEFNKIRKYIMTIDHSWNASMKEYITLYNSLK